MNVPPEAAGPRENRSPDWLLFFGKFLKQGTAIAALTPSSRWLARAVVGGIDFSRARCIVELGAGTGPITSELWRHRLPDCRSLVIERDPDFCTRLRRRFPEAEVVQADACDLESLLAERKIDAVDHIISGLPLPSFPAPLRDKILDVVGRRLTPTGTFRQLTHMPWVYFKLYRHYFDEVAFRFVPMNLPPGGVYICRGSRVHSGE